MKEVPPDDEARRASRQRLFDEILAEACEAIYWAVRRALLEELEKSNERRIAEEARREWRPDDDTRRSDE